MDLTKLAPPTDNLYKFLALFGLVVLVASAVLYYQSLFDFQKSHAQYIYDLEVQGTANLERVRLRNERVLKLFDEARAAEQKGDSASVQKALTEIQNSGSPPSFSELPERRRAEADRKIMVARTEVFGTVAILGQLLGAGLSALGFYLWYVRVQIYLDKELKERTQRLPLRARLTRK